MMTMARTGIYMVLLTVSTGAVALTPEREAREPTCKAVHASMVEERVTVGCKPGHSFCFLGEVTGSHGMRGATYFKGDSSGSRPPTSPDFLPYSGVFEYHLGDGVLITRETGVSNTTQGNPESGAITAFQTITEGTGDLAGTTGHLFVSGFNRGGRIETSVTGEICRP